MDFFSWSFLFINMMCNYTKSNSKTQLCIILQGVSKKIYSWKILPKLTSASIWRKLSVSRIRLTHSGTSRTKIISNYIVLWVGNVLLTGTLKTACAQKWVTKHDVSITWVEIWRMLYKLSKFWRTWYTLRQTREPKTLDFLSLP